MKSPSRGEACSRAWFWIWLAKRTEAKQLILDWLEAKQRWYAERRRAAAN